MNQALSKHEATQIRVLEAFYFGSFFQLLTLIAAAVTLFFFAASDTNYGTGGAKRVLDPAYHAYAAQGTTPNAFPSREEVESLLRQDKQITVLTGSPSADYRALKHDGGKQGTVYVKSVSPKRLELVARVHHDAIEEMDVDLPTPGVDHTTYHKLFSGQVHWSSYEWWLGGEASLFALLGLGVGLDEGKKKVARRRRWDELVGDSRLGPKEPEKGFSILLPHCEDTDDGVQMTIKQMIWHQHDSQPNGGSWREHDLYTHEYPKGLQIVSVPQDEVAQASERWFDFCSQVAEHNAANWRQTCADREAAAEAKREAEERQRREAEEAAAVAQAAEEKRLAPVLTPAPALMRQALDAQPLLPGEPTSD